ncbi:MAG: amidohydrolase, partial [Defluviitaleaceae bacterium]|nr:amidohydrolase [Defluviitaleaceae bacterium]
VMKQLFQADILLGDYSVLKGGYLGIDGDTIAYIGQEKPDGWQGAAVREMKGHLLMPGLYNMHTHSSMVLLRGLGSGLPLDRWLEEKIFPVEDKLTSEDISVGTRLSMLEMIASGVVSFSDMYVEPRVAVDEIVRAGMKANVNRPVMSFDMTEPYEKNFRVRESLAFYDDCHGLDDGRIRVDFGIHAEYTSHAEFDRKYGEDCKKRGAIMHLHLSETRKEHEECKARHGKTPAHWFADLGVLDNPTIAAHCVMVEPEDIEILLERGVTAVHNPSSNMKLGSGFMPLPKMLERGMNLALGTDGAASNNNLNMFEEMHLAAIIHCGYTNDPAFLRPTQLINMATLAGAKAQGREKCGALAVGNKADIVALNMNKPHLMPALDIPSLLTYSAQAGDVTMTMVDGKILYDNGAYLTIDVEKVRFDLDKTVGRLFE